MKEAPPGFEPGMADLQSVSNGLYLANTALIDISLRLQRSGTDYRRRGMELFEALLDLGVAEAVNVARSNDHRLGPGGYPIRLPRRRLARTTSPNSNPPPSPS